MCPKSSQSRLSSSIARTRIPERYSHGQSRLCTQRSDLQTYQQSNSGSKCLDLTGLTRKPEDLFQFYSPIERAQGHRKPNVDRHKSQEQGGAWLQSRCAPAHEPPPFAPDRPSRPWVTASG